MKHIKIISSIIILAMLVCLAACGQAGPGNAAASSDNAGAESMQNDGGSVDPDSSTNPGTSQEDEQMIYAHVNGNVLEIRPEANSSAAAFLERLREGDVTVDMHDYGGFEKVGPLGFSLPTNDEQITTQPGDVILYQGSQITIYYDTNSWSFTRLGRVQGMTQDELKAALGDGDAKVVFSLNGADDQAGVFNFTDHTVLLNSGYTMPILGFFGFELTAEEMSLINSLDRGEKHDWY